MSKYKQYFEDMVSQNKKLFEDFEKIHQKYMEDPKKYQSEFNDTGYQVQDIIRRYENLLCSHSQNSGFGKFSTNLSEKFQAEIKTHFSKINCIGLD